MLDVTRPLRSLGKSYFHSVASVSVFLHLASKAPGRLYCEFRAGSGLILEVPGRILEKFPASFRKIPGRGEEGSRKVPEGSEQGHLR